MLCSLIITNEHCIDTQCYYITDNCFHNKFFIQNLNFFRYKKMSTSRGSASRQRPQKYQNRTAFKNDLHDTSQKTKIINSLDITGVCKRCKDIIEWKIKYKKYKPLSAPRKCVNCEQKAIKHAYHMFCSKCSSEKQVCAKCCKPVEVRQYIIIN